MQLLTARDYTEARLREKLKNADYSPEAVDGALAYVVSFGYIDDARYARSFIRGRMERASRAKLKGELLQRGIDAEMVEEALAEIYADELLAGTDPEIAQIRRLIEKKRFDAAAATYEERQKFLAAAARRGFAPDKVRRVMEERA